MFSFLLVAMRCDLYTRSYVNKMDFGSTLVVLMHSTILISLVALLESPVINCCKSFIMVQAEAAL